MQVLGILLRRHPVDPCGTRRARVLVRLPQQVCITQVSQGREDPAWILGGLRRKALELWCTVGDLNVSPVVLSSST